MFQQILSSLPQNYPWTDRFAYLDTVDSTNDRLKLLAKQGAPHGSVLVAGHQSSGRGRLGRQFQSPEKAGVYLSCLLRPDCPPSQLMHLTCAVGAAMCNAVESAFGFRPGIKWTNDLVWQKKKLGGILTELGLTPQGMVDYAIVGIGINCTQSQQDFSPELQDTATSIQMIIGAPASRAKLAAAMMTALAAMDAGLLSEKQAMLTQYRQDCITIGQDISLVRGEQVRRGHALDVDEEGALVVSFPDGSIEAVSSGEVSVRGMYGYV